MLDKMIGVSPPPTGEALDTKLTDSRKFRDASGSDFKKDFEQALQRKLDQKLDQRKEDLAARKDAERRAQEQKAQELRAERRDKDRDRDESLGGTKKRVTEKDDKMVSNVMASPESKVETPDSQDGNTAKIKVDTAVKSKSETDADGVAARLTRALQGEAGSTDAGAQATGETPDGAAESALADAAALQAAQAGELAGATGDLAAKAADKAAQGAAAGFEAELGKAVDFTADPLTQRQSQELLQKMQAFDAEAGPLADKAQGAQSFEQNILNQLQKEQAFMTAPSDKSTAGQNDSAGKDSGQDSASFGGHSRDLKAELLNPNSLHQAAGQSHGDFKAHLHTVGGAQDVSGAGRLEDNRDANIREIMNQAQYLVKKGGGEMTVRMTPEGLGEVQLRVLLQDGKLNVEMQTQDKNVKKLIEESLSDLKSGLAAHRLSLEHVKIDTVNATNADNNTQFQSNLNQGGSQGQAREWNDFQSGWNQQQSRQGQSQGHGTRSAESSAAGASSVRSMSAAAPAQALRTYGGTKGATINRVA